MVKRLRRRPLTAKTGVRVPMEVPSTLLGFAPVPVGSFFTPPSLKAPVARAFPGNFAKWYESYNVFRHKKLAQTATVVVCAYFFLPHLRFSPNCLLGRHCYLHAVLEVENHAAVRRYGGLLHHCVPELRSKVVVHRHSGALQAFQEAGHGAALHFALLARCFHGLQLISRSSYRLDSCRYSRS